LGIKINKDESGRNQLTALPGGLIGKETILIAFLQGYRGNIEDLERTLYATVACRSAVMDGDPITDNTAHAIIQGALSLDNPRCPHGRPIWFELNREELFQLVGRT
jgi:DNA mismatch repair protein MutL